MVWASSSIVIDFKSIGNFVSIDIATYSTIKWYLTTFGSLAKLRD